MAPAATTSALSESFDSSEYITSVLEDTKGLVPPPPPRKVLEYLFKNRSQEEIANGVRALGVPPLSTHLRVHVGLPREISTDAVNESNNYETKLAERTELAKEILDKTLDDECNDRGFPHESLTSSITSPGILCVRGEGPFTVIPRRKHIYVDHKCGNAVCRGADVFACGILAASSDIQPGDRVSVYCDLQGKVLRGSTALLPNPEDSLLLGEGVCLVGREVFQVKWTELRGVGVRVTYPVWRGVCLGGSTRLCKDAEDTNPLMYLQNLPSITTTNSLNVMQDDVVLDMCAAPGNKTRHILDMLQGSGFVVAMDTSRPRARQMAKSLLAEFQGEYISNLHLRVVHSDSRASVASADEPVNELVERLNQKERTPDERAERISIVQEALCRGTSKESGGVVSLNPHSLPRGVFDRILLDAPCSALGQRPFLGRCDADVGHHPLVQRDLLRAALRLVRPLGIIVFSTCSPCYDECEAIVQLSEDLGLKVLSQERSPLCSGAERDSIGFFHAVLQRPL